MAKVCKCGERLLKLRRYKLAYQEAEFCCAAVVAVVCFFDDEIFPMVLTF